MSTELHRRIAAQNTGLTYKQVDTASALDAAVFVLARGGVEGNFDPSESVADVAAVIAIATLPPEVGAQVCQWLRAAKDTGIAEQEKYGGWRR